MANATREQLKEIVLEFIRDFTAFIWRSKHYNFVQSSYLFSLQVFTNQDSPERVCDKMDTGGAPVMALSKTFYDM